MNNLISLDSYRPVELPVSKQEKQKYSIKYYERLNIYKTSNVEFDPETEIATSYGWWIFVKRINKQLVFNNYQYSSSTSKHQCKVSLLIDQLGIKIDLFIECPQGLNNLDSSVAYYKSKIQELTDLINKKGTKKAKNTERKAEIKHLKAMIKTVTKLMKG